MEATTRSRSRWTTTQWAILAVVFAGAAFGSVAAAQGQPQAAVPDNHVEHARAFAEGPSEASGTAWQPAATPMMGWHDSAAAWTFMLHGQAFVQYLQESGEIHRRSRQAASTGSWAWPRDPSARAASRSGR